MCLATVNVVDRTNKYDWFTGYLYKKGFWVGGTKVRYSDYPDSIVRQTFRFFRSKTNNYLVIYILEFEEDFQMQKNYESFIKEAHSRLQIHVDFTLAIWPSSNPIFAVFKQDSYSENLNEVEALTFFSNFDPSMVGKSFNLKPINKSYTDFFHIWARKKMIGFQNDIDAFIQVNKQVHMLELKRPQESVKSWRPYRADTNNYIQLKSFTSMNNYLLTNIAYSVNEPGKLKIFKDVETRPDGGLIYKTTLIDLKPGQDILDLVATLDYEPENSIR